MMFNTLAANQYCIQLYLYIAYLNLKSLADEIYEHLIFKIM